MEVPWKASGFWPPFPIPVSVPPSNLADDPQLKICFNADWLPYVAGALKVLSRPETWIGSADDIARVTDQAQFIFDPLQFGQDCNCANWWFSPDYAPDSFCGDPLTIAWVTTVPTDCGNPIATVGQCDLNIIDGLARASLFGRDESGALSGGNVHRLFLRQTDATIGNVWSIKWEDCLGVEHIVTSAGLTYEMDDFQAQRICISALAQFVFEVETSGDLVCTSA